jgi:hypothetical protein
MKGVKGNEASIAIYRCAYTVIVRDGHGGTNADAHSVAIAKPDSYPVAVAISKPVTEPDT